MILQCNSLASFILVLNFVSWNKMNDCSYTCPVSLAGAIFFKSKFLQNYLSYFKYWNFSRFLEFLLIFDTKFAENLNIFYFLSFRSVSIEYQGSTIISVFLCSYAVGLSFLVFSLILCLSFSISNYFVRQQQQHVISHAGSTSHVSIKIWQLAPQGWFVIGRSELQHWQ